MWIDIFKTGKHGQYDYEFTEEDLDRIVEKYNNETEENQKAPLVKGHPIESDAPAYGWIEKLKRNGKILAAKIKDISNDVVNEIKEKRFRNISIALRNKTDLVHVGLLGGALPAVKGLMPLTLSDDLQDVEIINFSLYTEEEAQEMEKQLKYFQQKDELDILELHLDQLVKEGKIYPKHRIQIYSIAYKLKNNPDIPKEDCNEIIKELTESFMNENNIMEKIELSGNDFQFNDVDLDDRPNLHEQIVNYSQSKKISYEKAMNEIITNKKKGK